VRPVEGANCARDADDTLVPHGATLADMPTSHPRHTITETPPVRRALDELRAGLHGQRVDYAELVILGARAKARQLSNEGREAQEARRQLADWILSGSAPEVDVAAADEVKHRGLIAAHDA
jgi:hypothetical protein